jgi:hypothetical protein
VKHERIWIAVAALLPIAVLFGPALYKSGSFAFRDAGHFYYPLFEWCAREWGAGRIPLWNPQENLGTPVLADVSSSLFYPGKLVFALPIGFAARFKLYVVGHVLLAAAGSYWLARSWHASRIAAAIAAIAYSCGGGVVFQYSNVVYLVSAAWLPLAALAADRMLTARDWRMALLLGASLAMMILGGDPQGAYHALLAAALYAVLLLRGSAPGDASPGEPRGARLRGCVVRAAVSAALLAASAASMGLLSAIQVLPAAEATRLSDRAAYDRPRNLYECAGLWSRPAAAVDPRRESRIAVAARGLLGRPEPGSHHQQVYDFSIGPWRLAEYFWPNIGGRMFPENRRWFSLIPAERRTWTPTLYLGLLPVLLALSALRIRQVTPRERWLSWLVVLGTLGTFGWYGIGWAIHELYGAAGGDTSKLGIGQPVGGVYWFMVTVLPKYAYFRYPAKLLPLVALGLSQLAAVGWDRALAERRPALLRSLLALAVLSGIAAIAVACCGISVFAGYRGVDPWFGPFDPGGAWRDVLGAFGQTAVVAGLGAWLLRRAWSFPPGSASWPLLALLLTAADIALANYWLVPTAPAEVWQSESAAARAIPRRRLPQSPPLRFDRGSRTAWRPAEFARAGSSDRVVQIAAWEHDTLFPKHYLANNELALVESYGSIKLADYEAFWRFAKKRGPLQPNGTRLPHGAVLSLVGTEYLVVPANSQAPFARRVTASADVPGDPAGWSVWKIESTLPRAWIVHDVEVLPPLEFPLSVAEVEERTRRVLLPGGGSATSGRRLLSNPLAPCRLRNQPPTDPRAMRDARSCDTSRRGSQSKRLCRSGDLLC